MTEYNVDSTIKEQVRRDITDIRYDMFAAFASEQGLCIVLTPIPVASAGGAPCGHMSGEPKSEQVCRP